MHYIKVINDNYSHTEGDVAIIRIAGILREVCYLNNDFLAGQSKNQDQFIARADQRLYEVKKNRKKDGNKLR